MKKANWKCCDKGEVTLPEWKELIRLWEQNWDVFLTKYKGKILCCHNYNVLRDSLSKTILDEIPTSFITAKIKTKYGIRREYKHHCSSLYCIHSRKDYYENPEDIWAYQCLKCGKVTTRFDDGGY